MALAVTALAVTGLAVATFAGKQSQGGLRHSLLMDLVHSNDPMTSAPSSTSAIPIDPRIRVIAAAIAAAIPGAQIRLFGSRARGTFRPDSDVDLLITVPDEWLAGQDRLRVLGDLWRQYSSHRLPLDLLLYSECTAKAR
jgi:predicted nucleotidyltransferase